MTEIQKEPIETCCACGSSDLKLITALPKFPHVGIFINEREEEKNSPLVDNDLYACEFCGHVQLGYALDPGFLYTSEFQHRTSQSVTAKQANDFIFDFAQKVVGGKKVELVAEIGCNDTFLLQKFAEKGADVAGVDPIWRGNEHVFLEGLSEHLKPRFHVAGDFIENVDFEARFQKRPDVYITNFVFEHLKEPCEVVRSILDQAKPDATVIIGVPGAEFLLLNSRFDQLSHQHYQQFTIESLTHMIKRAGGEILDIGINFTVWGQIMVAFKKGTPVVESKVDMKFDPEGVQASFRSFNNQIDMMKERVRFLHDKEIYGMGAAQNFPVFAYFYGEEMPFSEILDDHPLRQNKMFPHFPYKIVTPSGSYVGSVGILTAADYGRVLVGRMAQLGFDHVVLPFTSV
tara:strand:+ start:1254 stop:2459 length:1206 start_codon:yes stop_codon:yes gene_type:complete